MLGGAEIMCENLINSLRTQGQDVVAVSLYNETSVITRRLEQNCVRIIYLNKKRGLDFSLYKKLLKIFKEERPDVIHTHLYTTKYVVPASVLAGVKKRVHTVHSIASKESGRFGRFLNRIFFKANKTIPVALSKKVQESIIEEYNLKKQQIPIIFNGIDLSKCQLKTTYLVDGKLKILHIGRFAEVKNHIGLIKAFALFQKKYPNSQLQLIGDGEKKQEIERFVQENGLTDSVQYLGVQGNVYEYLHNADIFTLPSLYEGIPMTLIEAMGTGLPIVATNVGGIPDMLINNESAILTLVDEVELSNAFIRLAGDESLRKKLGETAKRESLRFSSKIMAEKYIELYENIEIEIKN